jgi:hypothetical protein
MPWLGNFDFAYYEVGINVDRSTDEGFINYYSTPYIIWANDAAKRVTGNDFTGDGGSFSPGFLMGELFKLCSWEGEAYMQALRELQASVDIINAPRNIFRESGKLTDVLSPEATARYRSLRMMEIYRWSNFFY